MRLDKLTIGSPKDSPTHQFKNLKDVTIDFDQEHWVTVVIGWNGTGKSNVLEALATIFRDLIRKERKPAFAFKLDYRMGSGENERFIFIDADPDRDKEPYLIRVVSEAEAETTPSQPLFEPAEESASGKAIRLNAFVADDSRYLPRHVFGYYSGESNRLYEVFHPYLKNQYGLSLRSGKNPGPKRLFYALPVHSQFVLLAFLIQQNDVMRGFLEKHLGLDPDEGIESVLFVLRQPPWKSKSKDGDPRFWNARGVVRDFLDRLYRIALAPIRIKRRVAATLWNDENLEFLYLYVKDIGALRQLVGNQPPAEFFRDLESTYVSELIEEVRIRVRLKKNDGSVTFREMSEGEQQLLTVLGLLRFTAGEESLFLLDEPDTHLNPRWSVDYLSYLRDFVGAETKNQETSHIVLTTHNPLSIAELEKGQVQILKRNEQTKSIEADPPELDPKGMGYAGIITSDLFGLGSSLDNSTNEDLINLHKLSLKEDLNNTDKAKLVEIRERIEKLDFNFASPDRLEQEFMRARFDLAKGTDFDDPILTQYCGHF
jgi:predicted ATPase